MNKSLIKQLCCPACRASSLALTGTNSGKAEIPNGQLRCKRCNQTYAIVDGLPVMLTPDQASTAGVWKSLHQRTDYAKYVALMKKRMDLARDILNDYFTHAGLIREQGITHNVLDIGCGSGTYSLALAVLADIKELTLLDISPAALLGAGQLMQAFGIKAHLVVGDIHSLPFENNRFQLALSGGLIEHFTGPEQTAIVAEHCRVAPQVMLQVPTGTPAYWCFRLLYSVIKGGWPFGFEKPVARSHLIKLLYEQDYQPQAWSSHNFASSLVFLGKQRWAAFPAVHKWPGMALFSQHDLIVMARRPTTKNSDGIK